MATSSSRRRTHRPSPRMAGGSRAGSHGWSWRVPEPACRAQIASRCSATATETASPRAAPSSLKGYIPPSAWRLWVAISTSPDTDAILRFPYQVGETRITAPGVRVADLPAGPINHHWTKNIIASGDGQRLYVTVGSNSNAAENGIEAEEGRAAIWQIDLQTGRHRIYASGLRNPVGLAWEPTTGALWTVVNERDEIGSDLVPDYMTAVRDGGFYGWPYSYYGQHIDERVQPQRPDLVAR